MHKQITLHRLEKSVHNNLLNSKQGLTYTVKTVVFLKFIVNAIFWGTEFQSRNYFRN